MKNLILFILTIGLISCSTQKKEITIVSVTALTEVFGDGQKTTAAILEYSTPVKNETLRNGVFSVKGRTITKVYANDTVQKTDKGKDGKFVIVELSSDDENAETFIPKGKDSEILKASVTVKQERDIETSGGSRVKAWTETVSNGNKTINLIVDDFSQHEFNDPETGITVKYNLYIPENYDKNKSYPMVMFIHDAGVVSTEVKATLMQGLGAVIWAGPEEQAKHKAFVLAPQYSVVTVNDQSEYTQDLDATVNLIHELTQKYSIDTNRLYTTGQSMGCMSSIVLNFKYPDLFAASYLVAGQWDPSVTAPLAKDNLWILVSEGDAKAFPGMNAVTAFLEKEGAKVCRKTFNGRSTAAGFDRDVKDILSGGCKINYTPLQAGTVVPREMTGQGGADHRATWRIAYNIDGIRDWLFSQTKK